MSESRQIERVCRGSGTAAILRTYQKYDSKSDPTSRIAKGNVATAGARHDHIAHWSRNGRQFSMMSRSFVVAHSVHFQRALQARVHPRFLSSFTVFFVYRHRWRSSPVSRLSRQTSFYRVKIASTIGAVSYTPPTPPTTLPVSLTVARCSLIK